MKSSTYKKKGSISFSGGVEVRELPEEEMLAAREARMGSFDEAPDHDILWDGDEREFWPEEKTQSEVDLIVVLRQMRVSLQYHLNVNFMAIVGNYKRRHDPDFTYEPEEIPSKDPVYPQFTSAQDEELQLRGEFAALFEDSVDGLDESDVETDRRAVKALFEPTILSKAEREADLEEGLMRMQVVVDKVMHDELMRVAVGIYGDFVPLGEEDEGKEGEGKEEKERKEKEEEEEKRKKKEEEENRKEQEEEERQREEERHREEERQREEEKRKEEELKESKKLQEEEHKHHQEEHEKKNQAAASLALEARHKKKKTPKKPSKKKVLVVPPSTHKYESSDEEEDIFTSSTRVQGEVKPTQGEFKRTRDRSGTQHTNVTSKDPVSVPVLALSVAITLLFMFIDQVVVFLTRALAKDKQLGDDPSSDQAKPFPVILGLVVIAVWAAFVSGAFS